jgi:hypothetical protein
LLLSIVPVRRCGIRPPRPYCARVLFNLMMTDIMATESMEGHGKTSNRCSFFPCFSVDSVAINKNTGTQHPDALCSLSHLPRGELLSPREHIPVLQPLAPGSVGVSGDSLNPVGTATDAGAGLSRCRPAPRSGGPVIANYFGRFG